VKTRAAVIAFVGLLATLGGRAVHAQNACVGAMRPPRPRLFLETVPKSASDSVVHVRVCLAAQPGVRAGSFHLVIDYDSTATRAVTARARGGAPQAANTTVPGRVSIAGASPSGLEQGLLSTVTFKAGTGRWNMRLRVLELNATDGSPMLTRETPSSTPRAAAASTATHATSAPRLERLEPAQATLQPGTIPEVIIHGSGFTPEGNILTLGPSVLGELRSTDGVTLRLLLPATWPSSGEAPPRVIPAGVHALTIRNTRGLSNPIPLTLVTP
jgi:hypothetical protein